MNIRRPAVKFTLTGREAELTLDAIAEYLYSHMADMPADDYASLKSAHDYLKVKIASDTPD